jgi:uncharacterized alkaline shock family protein YloU
MDLAGPHGPMIIHEDVVAGVAGLAALGVPGVVGIQAQGGAWADLLHREALTRGVKVRDGDDGMSLAVDVYLVVAYGVRIPDVAAEVRRRVRAALVDHFGVSDARVTIHVVDVRTPRAES